MNPEVHTTLLNMKCLNLMEMILKALRGRFTQDDQMDCRLSTRNLA